jgi:hypothetical protein
MTNHDLFVFALGSLSGFSLAFFVFACWYSEQHKAMHNAKEREVADAKRIAWADGYKSASRNHVNNLSASKQ